MSVTLREVAQAAGVSVAAASKVLHGRGDSIRVSQQRALEIRAVAERLAYYPNALARNLRGRRTHTIGLIFENFGDLSNGPQYYSQLIAGVGTRIFPEHYRLTLLPELDHDDVMGTLADGHLEGVIWCKLARDQAIIDQIARCPIPIVAFNTPPTVAGTKAVFVSCDNEGGMEMAVDHLWNLGHRKFLFVHEYQEANTPDCVARRDGFLSSVARRGGSAKVVAWEWHLQQFEDWWATEPQETAVVGWTERVGGVVLQHAARLGISVPEQLSVVGFDSTAYCDATRPRLTAVRQPIFDMAQHASGLLLNLIQGIRPENDSTIFPCVLDIRDSTAQAPQR
jgi:LacI family transcriptional regulator